MPALPVTVDTLSALYPFAKVDEHRLGQLLNLCHRESFRQAIDPFRQRDWGGQIVYLTRGELKMRFADGTVRVLVGGSDRALFPVAQPGQMPISTRAITDVELMRVEEDAADIIVTWDQCLQESDAAWSTPAARAADRRTVPGMFAAQRLTYGVFAALPPAHIAALLERFQRRAFKRGDIVIRQGAPGDYYYLIEQGSCLVTRDIDGDSIALAELKSGDAFGEEALASDTPRNATVTMHSDGVLLMLGKTDFDELLREPLLRHCSPDEAIERARQGAVWLDVRFAAEYRHDGLSRAINIPLSELRSALHLLDKRREYIVYCQTGRRSAAAAFLLSQRGFKVALLDGGLRALAGPTV